MKTASIYGAFNARWLEPEDVARSFIPTVHYKSLVRFENSLLMGPRGCGKTTLLKMLTRRAQRVWIQERLSHEQQWRDYRIPEFEAIYIPSDTRWSFELTSVAREFAELPIDAERLQRAIVGISALIEASRVFQVILDEVPENPAEILKGLIREFHLGPTIPSFREFRLRLLSLLDEILELVVRRDSKALKRTLSSLSPSITSHALSATTKACTIFEEFAPSVSPRRWAMCFDELEIAPPWLQGELFGALRSFDQRFLLKLTWSPVLPSDLLQHREQQHDYAAIRMWHGHAADAKPFCKVFSTRFLRDRLSDLQITPAEVFGPSPFAQEDDSPETYGHGSPIWKSMVALAEKDQSFRTYLLEQKIDPSNPIAEQISTRDEALRKAKPLVLMREAILKRAASGLGRRSRKNPVLYYGEDAIYAMSEGNPRLLAGLLNELLDVETVAGRDHSPKIRPEVQARALLAASHRLLSGIRTYPVHRESRGPTLLSLIDKLGRHLHLELVAGDFTDDPVGSFTVDTEVSEGIVKEISIGLLIGCFVYVTSSGSDIPSAVRGARIRLSYMLAPSYRLLFRNYRGIRLSTALRISASTQRMMFRQEQE